MLKLREIRKQKNLSMKELGAILGLAESTISLYENGKREPDIATLIKIANYFNVSVDELLGCSDLDDDTMNADYRSTIREVHTPAIINFENMCKSLDEKTLDRIHSILYSLRRMQNNSAIYVSDKQFLFSCIAEVVGRIERYVDDFRSASEYGKNLDFSDFNKRFINGEVEVLKEITNIVTPQKKPSNERHIVIPLYETPASAGLGMWLNDETPVEWVTVPRNEKTSAADFLLEIRGDSMEPKFYDGDRVLVKQTESIYEGEIGVFILNNESYIKKMGRKELISLNPAYEPIKLTEYDDVRCAGKVLGTLNLE